MTCNALRFLIVLALLALLPSCGSSNLFSSETKLFPGQVKLFSSQDWATAIKVSAPDMKAVGPASPEDLIDASGRCVAQAAAQPSDVAVGTVAGDLGTTAVVAQPAVATVQGGVALGMTECQVAARAGQPSQVNIAGDDKNDRKAVLTYASGPWPGIYTFSAGRLKEIERVAQSEPPKPAQKKSKGTRPATASATQTVR